DLRIKYTELRHDPLTKVRLPEELFLPAEVQAEAKVLGDFTIANTNIEFILRCVKSGAEVRVRAFVHIKGGMIEIGGELEVLGQVIRDTKSIASGCHGSRRIYIG